MKRLIAIALLTSLSACASIVTGSGQNVSVQTTPEAGASCELKNDVGTWFVPATPGSVSIDRSYSDLTVNCKKPASSLTGIATVSSGTKGIAFGNIVAGGIIGAAVDVGTGAAYDYPSLITVPLSADAD